VGAGRTPLVAGTNGVRYTVSRWSWGPPDLPVFTLTTGEDLIVRPEDWERRDTVRGCGSDAASVLFAEFLSMWVVPTIQWMSTNWRARAGSATWGNTARRYNYSFLAASGGATNCDPARPLDRYA